MSYDILLFPRHPGQDWEEVLAADELDGPEGTQADLDEGVATFRRIEARLRDQLTGPVETWVAEEVGGDVYGELTVPGSGLQVELYDRSASVSLGGGEGDGDAEAAHEQARMAVSVVAEETGYEPYDPQRKADFDGTVVAAVEEPAPSAREAALMAMRRDPGVMRRRAYLYLGIGLVLALLGVYRLFGGQGGWLTWLVLAIGVFDLIGGLMMMSLARQITEAEEKDTSTSSSDPVEQ
jgi:hypothetical protein